MAKRVKTAPTILISWPDVSGLWAEKSDGGRLIPALMTFRLPALEVSDSADASATNGATSRIDKRRVVLWTHIARTAYEALPAEWLGKVERIEVGATDKRGRESEATVRLWLRSTETPWTIDPAEPYGRPVPDMPMARTMSGRVAPDRKPRAPRASAPAFNPHKATPSRRANGHATTRPLPLSRAAWRLLCYLRYMARTGNGRTTVTALLQRDRSARGRPIRELVARGKIIVEGDKVTHT